MITVPIIKVGSGYADTDYALLGRHLRLLDFEINRVSEAILLSRDPEADGLCESGEYFIGNGFVAVQRYLTTTRTNLRVRLSDALDVPPMLKGDISLVAVLNAAANYWKHVEEWIEAIGRSESAELDKRALGALQQIEAVTPWQDYTCANLLAALSDSGTLQLSRLLPAIADWRHNLVTRL